MSHTTKTDDVLFNAYGNLLVVRPPVPATCNKAGANYKSEVAHQDYSPRRAYDEWLTICEAITNLCSDALVTFEAADDALLDVGNLQVDGDGNICPEGSTEVLASMNDIMTGRIFAANGPWVAASDTALRAVMPNMINHRQREGGYYRDLLATIAELAGLELDIVDNPHSWEGMADVAVVGDQVVLTYAVSGHYDGAVAPKTIRSSRAGVDFAADFVGVPKSARVYAELVYPHFHGDTVHFGLRPGGGPAPECTPVLVHYPGGLWNDGSAHVISELSGNSVHIISQNDAVEEYAGNSRQVSFGLLVPDGVSSEFTHVMETMGLLIYRIPLTELFGKAGGGPACATLNLPGNLTLPRNAPIRYSVSRDTIRARRERIPERLRVSPDFFAGKQRG